MVFILRILVILQRLHIFPSDALLEYYYKEDSLDDPMISRDHVQAFNWATKKEIDKIDSDLATVYWLSLDFVFLHASFAHLTNK